MRFSTTAIAAATGGTTHGAPAEVDGATQDSRAVMPGQLFVPIVAERDGHDFIGAARANGASAYLTAREPQDGSAIRVDDTLSALQALASMARDRIEGPVVGITGSVGKTSTKDLLASVLRTTYATHASAKSFNNEIGVPLTLLNAPEDAQAVIVEMGSRGIGHVAELCDIARPTVGVITTVAAAHTGEFGSVETIAKAKGELVECLPADGLAVLNGDVRLCRDLADRTSARVITFGRSDECDVQLVSVTLDDELRATIVLDTPWGRLEAQPSTRGAHLAGNAAAAAAVGLWMGASTTDVSVGLATAELSPWRMEINRSSAGATIINDAYNANPTSMRGAIDSLAALGHRRKIAVVGYMAELGGDEIADHRSIAEYVRAAGAELVAVGTDLYDGEPVADPVAHIGTLDAETAILVKGSRSAGLEAVAGRLAQ
ncbi:MAG: UDP-N-acetylmuramoyl-tripeptide--D-alanyl-D-alanine ligase [Acidimicrobiales bacterium]